MYIVDSGAAAHMMVISSLAQKEKNTFHRPEKQKFLFIHTASGVVQCTAEAKANVQKLGNSVVNWYQTLRQYCCSRWDTHTRDSQEREPLIDLKTKKTIEPHVTSTMMSSLWSARSRTPLHPCHRHHRSIPTQLKCQAYARRQRCGAHHAKPCGAIRREDLESPTLEKHNQFWETRNKKKMSLMCQLRMDLGGELGTTYELVLSFTFRQ